MRFRPVTGCICTGYSFAELKECGLSTADEIADEFGSGVQCGLCRPYIERMLRTGETEFPLYPPVELLPEPDDLGPRLG